jgi:RNA polymerase sigma-70 factor (ECF subfamily)
MAINYSKKKFRYASRQVEFNDEWQYQNATQDAAHQVDQKEQEGMVQSFLERLNPEQRACLIMRSLQGMSYQEIAETLKININTVRSRLKRAREAMMAMKREVVNHEL